MKFACGSNFDIINLECGVNLIENKKKKTGGKDYYKKYGRCSFEIFQDQLNKTTSNFGQLDNNIINININDSNNDNDKYLKTEFDLPPLNLKKMRREKTEYEIKNIEPNVAGDILNVKTKNLKLALSSLDLINENNIKGINEQNLDKQINILKNNNIKEIKKEKDKKDFGDINVFNKTLMKNKLWGDPNESFKNTPYMTRKDPIKPNKKLLQKEISHNELNRSPRRRLPPISPTLKLYEEQANQMNNGKNNIKNKSKKKLKEMKNLNLSKDSLENNKNKYFTANTSGVYNINNNE